MDGMRRSVLSVVSFGKGRNLLRNGSTQPVSLFEWGASTERPYLSDGGLRHPNVEDGLYQVDPPRTSPACEGGASGDAADDSDGEITGLPGCVAEMPQHCEASRAYKETPHLPIAGTSSVSPFNEKLRVDLLFSRDAIPRTPRKRGMPLAGRRSRLPAGRNVFSCIRAANGEIKFGRIFGQDAK